MSPSKTVSNQQIYDELQALKAEVQQLDRIVRGSDGHPGLSNEVNKQSSRIDEAIALLKTLVAEARNKEVPTKPLPEEKKDETVVRWPYLMDKFFAPILVGILTAVLVTTILHAIASAP